MDTIASHTQPPELTRLVEEILEYRDVRVQYHRRKKPACAISSLALSSKSMRLISWSRKFSRTDRISDVMSIFSRIQKVSNKKGRAIAGPAIMFPADWILSSPSPDGSSETSQARTENQNCGRFRNRRKLLPSANIRWIS